MAKARITQIAEAVATRLNDGDFSIEFDAGVRLRREKKVHELEQLDVGVFRFGQTPTPEEDQTGDRGGDEIEYTIEIAVRQKVKTDDDVEPLIILCEEIRSFCSRLGLETVAGEVFSSGATYDPVYDEEHFTKGIFFGLVTVPFRGFEE